jgi:hypothetical protein
LHDARHPHSVRLGGGRLLVTSIAIGADGLGLISYDDATNGKLKVAHCADAACSGATTATLDAAGSGGRYPSVTTGVDGLGLISYFAVTNADLRVAHLGNVLGLPYVRPR